MRDLVLELPPVELDDIIAITQQVWSSFLDLELTARPPGTAELATPALSATLRISGAWQGAVVLECTADHAAAAAAVMFSTAPGSASQEQARDALGELANVVAGNIKSLLPAPSALSMPSVTWAGRPDGPPVCGLLLLRQVAFVALPGILRVSIWKAGGA